MLKKTAAKPVGMLVLAFALAGAFGAATVQAQAAPRLNYNEVLMANGQSTTVKVTGASSKAKWSSSKKSVVTVKASGKKKATAKLKAKKTGSATIKAKVGKKTLKAHVSIVKKSGRTLIAYMSWSGTTKSVAGRIRSLTGADIVQIKPRKAYTKDYDTLTRVAQNEQNKNARPALGTKVVNAKQYRTIVLGYPIWWGTEPMLIRSFLTKTNVSGKTIVPFSTSMGSGFSGSRAGIVRYAKGATVKTGRDLSDASNSEISSWLTAQGVALKGTSSSTSTAGTNSRSGSQGSQVNTTGADQQQATTPTDSSTTRDQDARTTSGKAIVVYWSASASGNTRSVAEKIAGHLGAPSYELQPAEPYSSADLNWRKASSRVNVEHATNTGDSPLTSTLRPALTGDVENWSSYDTVYLGYPIWWAQAPHLLYTFVESHDFTGKTVIPFCTSSSSPIGTSGSNLATAAKTGTWLAGQRFSGSASQESVNTWLDGLKLS